MTSFETLRKKHTQFTYKSFTIKQTPDELIIGFHFLLSPDIQFFPTTRIPYKGTIDTEQLYPFVFSLGMIEAISYWKAACPALFLVEAGYLNQEQILWWKDLYMQGLGEFFYKNAIDFTQDQFLTIQATGNAYHGNVVTRKYEHDLVLIGGGRDSVVALGLLQQSKKTIQTMIVNPIQSALDVVKTAGLPKPIVVQRTIDAQLLSLNTNGYLNGHTPFSALLAFLGLLVAEVYGFEHIIVANERSADEGNVFYKGMDINHQYSKSFRFEQAFRSYVALYLTEHIHYFSLLRPLNDLQISALFAQFPQFFSSFRSCNVGKSTNTWCGTCPKCAFTYLALAAFVPKHELLQIFGSDFFYNDSILSHIRGLVGLEKVKPFECVGTRDEAKTALVLAIDAYKKESLEVPPGLLLIKSDLGAMHQAKQIISDAHNVPKEYMAIVKHRYEQ